MSKKNPKKIKFHSEEKQLEYEQQISNKFGSKLVNESKNNMATYSNKQQQLILEECNDIFASLAKELHNGADSIHVQNILVDWHNFIKKFFNPSTDALRGLGLMYAAHPEFRELFSSFNPDLPDFLPTAIDFYVDALEDSWLESQYNDLQH